MRLYVVRHGQTAWNELGKAQGHTDIVLDAAGLRQAEALGEAFRDLPLDRILTSDLARAHETGRAISRATGVAAEVLPALRERCFGDWEGSPFTDVGAWCQEGAASDGVHLLEYRPPNGEAIADIWRRLDPIVADLAVTQDRVAVVTHGGTGAVLLARLMRRTLETTRSFRFGNTGVTELHRREDGYFVIVRYNDVSHLAEERPLIGSVDGLAR